MRKLDENLETMRYRFHADKNKDIILRPFATKSGKQCFVVFIDGMASMQSINDFIIRPMMLWSDPDTPTENIIQIGDFTATEEIDEVVQAVLSGNSAVFVDGQATCITCETKGFDSRSISTPTTEKTIKGSQEAFTESVRTNTTQIHRIIKNEHLITEFIPVGSVNNIQCAIMYLDNIVNKHLLEEVRERLSTIKMDFIMGTGMVSQLIEDSPLSLFPSTLSTERPDRCANYIAGGRVVILVDGVPFGIVVPVTISLLLDSPEGSSQRWINGTFSRMIRLVALFCTTMLSGIYLATILFHRDMLPTILLGAIMKASANIPFSSLLEILVMELFFELIKEAGLRIPSTLGSAISIVGALILGQSAVEANLVSPVSLIIVALSGLGNTALPDYELAFGIRVVKLTFILLGASLGFLGICFGVALFMIVLSNQNSFGIPMFSIQGLKWSAGTPLFFQLPVWMQEFRSRQLRTQKPRSAPPTSRPWTRKQKER